jgi:hypothetical protein
VPILSIRSTPWAAKNARTRNTKPMAEQIGVGGMVDVGLDHRGVDAQLASPQDPVRGQFAHQRRVELIEHLRTSLPDQR